MIFHVKVFSSLVRVCICVWRLYDLSLSIRTHRKQQHIKTTIVKKREEKILLDFVCPCIIIIITEYFQHFFLLSIFRFLKAAKNISHQQNHERIKWKDSESVGVRVRKSENRERMNECVCVSVCVRECVWARGNELANRARKSDRVERMKNTLV